MPGLTDLSPDQVLHQLRLSIDQLEAKLEHTHSEIKTIKGSYAADTELQAVVKQRLLDLEKVRDDGIEDLTLMRRELREFTAQSSSPIPPQSTVSVNTRRPRGDGRSLHGYSDPGYPNSALLEAPNVADAPLTESFLEKEAAAFGGAKPKLPSLSNVTAQPTPSYAATLNRPSREKVTGAATVHAPVRSFSRRTLHTSNPYNPPNHFNTSSPTVGNTYTHQANTDVNNRKRFPFVNYNNRKKIRRTTFADDRANVLADVTDYFQSGSTASTLTSSVATSNLAQSNTPANHSKSQQPPLPHTAATQPTFPSQPHALPTSIPTSQNPAPPMPAHPIQTYQFPAPTVVHPPVQIPVTADPAPLLNAHAQSNYYSPRPSNMPNPSLPPHFRFPAYPPPNVFPVLAQPAPSNASLTPDVAALDFDDSLASITPCVNNTTTNVERMADQATQEQMDTEPSPPTSNDTNTQQQPPTSQDTNTQQTSPTPNNTNPKQEPFQISSLLNNIKPNYYNSNYGNENYRDRNLPCAPFRNNDQDFSLFRSRFERTKKARKWSDDDALTNLTHLLQAPVAEQVLRSKRLDDWSYTSLLDACEKWIGRPLSLIQLGNELQKITHKKSEDVMDLVTRIEDVAKRAAKVIPSRTVERQKYECFMRCIHPILPMYNYVLRNDTEQDDVRRAMELAQEFEEKDGGDHLWYLQQKLQAANITEPLTSADLTSSLPSANMIDADVFDSVEPEIVMRAWLNAKRKPKNLDELWEIVVKNFNEIKRNENRKSANDRAKHAQRSLTPSNNNHSNSSTRSNSPNRWSQNTSRSNSPNKWRNNNNSYQRPSSPKPWSKNGFQRNRSPSPKPWFKSNQSRPNSPKPYNSQRPHSPNRSPNYQQYPQRPQSQNNTNTKYYYTQDGKKMRVQVTETLVPADDPVTSGNGNGQQAPAADSGQAQTE